MREILQWSTIKVTNLRHSRMKNAKQNGKISPNPLEISSKLWYNNIC